METATPIDKQIKICLAVLLLTGLFMRLWHLDFQSLWIDELNTMQETGPGVSWAELFGYLKTADQHPPLYYIIVKPFVHLFGHTAVTVRAVSAMLGTAGIYAMFLLGREMWNTRVGLIAAAITTFNYFDLYYSQDARCYILAFLTAALSFLYLLKLLKELSLKNAIGYGVATLLFLYSHYYGIFAVLAQFIIVVICMMTVRGPERKLFIKRFLLGGGIALAGFLPLLPYLDYLNHITSFWITPTKDSFMTDYFLDYFGDSNLLKPVLIFALLLYLFRVFTSKYDKTKAITEQPLSLGFIILSTWIFVTNFTPYIRSLLMIPMMIPRYTIMALPAYIIAVATGINYINNRAVRSAIMILFILLSLSDIILVKNYYNTVTKEQFRELTHFVIERNDEHMPIVEEKYTWQHSYYFDLYHNHPIWLQGKKERIIDSVLKLASTPQAVDAFWMIGGHIDSLPKKEKLDALRTAYYPAVEKTMCGAWARLYYAKNPADSNIRYLSFTEGTAGSAQKSLILWGKEWKSSNPVRLAPGRYAITVSAISSPVRDTFAHIKMSVDNKPLSEFQTDGEFEVYKFTLNCTGASEHIFKLCMTNDKQDIAAGEDRNAFILFVRLRKTGN